MSTWFKLYREIFDSDIWYDVTTFRLFLFLIGKASHQDGVKISGIELKRGQYLRSYRKLAEDLAYKEGRGTKTYSLKTIKKCIDKLISDERVNVQETEQGTLFTILNYDKYQGFLDDENKTVNTLSVEVETNGKRTGNNNNNAKNAKKDNNISTTKDDAIVFFQNNFGMPGPYEQESILMWINDSGEQMVLEAMKRAIKRNKKSWGYTEKILKNWARKNITTIEQAKAEEVEFQNQYSNVRPFKPKYPQMIGTSYDPSKDRF